MREALSFFETYEAAIYFILGLGGILYAWRFYGAWQELRTAVYGLERDSAQGRLNQASVSLFFLFLIASSVFSIVTFVIPILPVVEPTRAAQPQQPGLTLTPEISTSETPNDILATATLLPTVAVSEENCDPETINISSPQSGETISGAVEISGTVDVENFGFYKFKYARPQDGLWLTVLAERLIVQDGVLVANWDTSRLPPGEYVLQILVTDTNGDELPPCRVSVVIAAPSQ
jgi:hypothetical protein